MSQHNPDTTPALPPPDGVKPNFENPDCQAGAAYAAMSILLGASSLLLAARMYTKAFVVRHLDSDDYLLVIGWATYAASVGLNYTQLPGIISCHQWDVTITEMLTFLKDLYVAEVIYCIEILFVKLGALIQLKRIFFGTKKNLTYWLLISLIIINTTFYVLTFFLAIFQCLPIEKSWNKTLEGKCIDVNALIVGTAGFNVTVDFSMLGLPLYSIGQLMISTKRKLGIGAIFATGVLATVASALRLAYSIQLTRASDVTFVFPNFLWASNLEVVSIIVAASFPVMPRLFKHLQGRDRTQSGGDYRTNTFHSNSTFKNLRKQQPARPQPMTGAGTTLNFVAKNLTRSDSSSNLRDEWVALDDFHQHQQGLTHYVDVGNGRASSRAERVADPNKGTVRTVRVEAKFDPVGRG